MKKKVIKFQSVKVEFPETLYLGTMWIMNKENKPVIYPMHELQTDAKSTLEAAKNLYEDLQRIGYKVLDHFIITKLVYSEKVPLLKEYWENPQINFHEYHRMTKFADILNHYKSYKILVTPKSAIKNTFGAAIPFLNSAEKKDIEAFMYSSDWYVDPLADASAFYKPEEPLTLNLFTGKVFEKAKNKKVKKILLN